MTKKRKNSAVELQSAHEAGIYFASKLTRRELEQYLSSSSEYALLSDLKVDGLDNKVGAAVHMLWAFRNDRSGSWPYISRAIGRNRLALAFELLLLANANQHREFDAAVLDSGLRHLTAMEEHEQRRQYGAPMRLGMGMRLG